MYILSAKIVCLARKIWLVWKNISKWPIFVCTNMGYLTLKDPGRQTVQTISVVPLKFDEYDNSWAKFKVGGIKIECTQIRYFLSPYVHQNWSKSDFFRETLCTWIFSTVLVPTKSLRIEHSETYLVCIIIGEPFFGLFWAISELGSSGYIVKLAILIVSVFWVFFAINQIVCQR